MKMKTRLPSPSLTLLQRKILVNNHYRLASAAQNRTLPSLPALLREAYFSETPEGVPHRDGVLRHHVSSIFLIHIMDPVKIKLRLDENVRFHVDLHTHRAVQLKMIGAPEQGTLVVADRGGGAGLLAEI